MSADFLSRAGWAGAAARPLAGDASARRYTRLSRADDRAILMEDPGGDVALFARLAEHLLSLGLSAPRILARDDAAGLMLIEDLGDALFARLAADDPAQEAALYAVAVDALAVLHAAPPAEGLTAATPETLAQMTDLAFDWYLTGAGGAPDPAARSEVEARLRDVLEVHAPAADVTILRDFHAENLLWLPGRAGAARAGLLDFQDALAGHRAYDLMSLLQDARRDVAPETEASAIRRYLDATGEDAEGFAAAIAALGTQRNLRILGVFARLAATQGKARYLPLLPRVWGHLMRDLDHPALSAVAGPLRAALPVPGPAVIARLEDACRTH